MGRMGFGPFESDDGDGMAFQTEAVLAKPLLKALTRKGAWYAFDEAYAAVALALMIERASPGLFSDDPTPAPETPRVALPRAKRRRYYSFWDLSEQALRALLVFLGRVDDTGNIVTLPKPPSCAHPSHKADAEDRRLIADQLEALLAEVQAARKRRRCDEESRQATRDMFARPLTKKGKGGRTLRHKCEPAC